jgi:hypothetical protein
MGDYQIIGVKNGWMIFQPVDRNGAMCMKESIVFTEFDALTKWIKENIKPLPLISPH